VGKRKAYRKVDKETEDLVGIITYRKDEGIACTIERGVWIYVAFSSATTHILKSTTAPLFSIVFYGYWPSLFIRGLYQIGNAHIKDQVLFAPSGSLMLSFEQL